MYLRMRSSVKSLIHKSSRNAITWAEPILKVLVLVFAFAAWGWGLSLEAWGLTFANIWSLRIRCSAVGN